VSCPVFTVGQAVVCRVARNYRDYLSAGKTYTVSAYGPRIRDLDSYGFTWPAYVEVIGDTGTRVWCHAARFEAAPQPTQQFGDYAGRTVGPE
jgi:hypothetical protein